MKLFLYHFKQRLMDCYLQIWNTTNENSKRYKCFRTFQKELRLEKYLKIIDIRKFRDVAMEFRFGINSLKRNNRYPVASNTECPFCAEKEEEEHFLLECSAYKDLHHRYLRSRLPIATNAFTVLKLMKNPRRYKTEISCSVNILHIQYAGKQTPRKLSM